MVFFFLFGLLYLKAQDTLLPQGKSTIYLYSDKVYKHVQLWKIDSIKVEFVKGGNLADVLTSAVKKIETPTYYIEFDEHNRILKKQYDVILPFHKDSIFCTIISINDYAIVYLPLGGKYNKVLPKYNIKYFNKRSEFFEEKNNFKTIVNSNYIGSDTISADINYELLAKTNAKKYFNGRPAFMGGFISGLLFPYGWASAGIIAAVPPTKIKNLQYPNSEFLNKDQTYAKEFKKRTHNIKAKKVLFGFLAGVGTDIVIGLLVVASGL